MPPLRRYLRLTHSSAIEVRIYLDNPADTTRWLLLPSSPALARVIEAVRPLVLPKLREENANNPNVGRGGKARRKGWKDVVVSDEFEVSVFLTETSTRHSILRKYKSAKDEAAPRLGTTNGKMTGASRDAPVEVGEDAAGLLREDEDADGGKELGQIPLAKEETTERLFVSDDEDEIVESGRKEKGTEKTSRNEGDDDKKKMGMKTTYDGFSIWGRILCLVVKRKGGAKGKEVSGGSGAGGGHAMMEDWIASTQMPEGRMMDE